MVPTSNSLASFFAPKGVAVIGASHDPTKLGYGLARNLIQSNYKGAVHLINPKGGSLFGQPMYASVLEIPDPVDLAILLIPAALVFGAIEQCAERGIKAVIIGSGGFRETGPEGAALEDECLRLARKHEMRLIGPNCIGLLDTHLPMDATFLPPPGPLPGEVAFISHSGAICAAIIDWARGHSFGLSRLVSLGNQADVNETDVLKPVADDPFNPRPHPLSRRNPKRPPLCFRSRHHHQAETDHCPKSRALCFRSASGSVPYRRVSRAGKRL